jgi:glycolate oxidase FAD binding subunit
MAAELDAMAARIGAAAARGQALCIRAGGTKDFYGNLPRGEVLDPRAWRGIESHEPTELVISARAGTPLAEVEAALAAHGQMLAFEPPHFGAAATIGGCVAAGLAGPRRSAAGFASGGVRDAVLGARLLDGRGRLLRFGGTVMKNVAGYDVSRVLAGSLGILGVIVDVSLKVLPQPAVEATLRFELSEARALELLNLCGGQPLPVSASCWRAGCLTLRLSGSGAAVRQACALLGGEVLAAADAPGFWRNLREQADAVVAADAPLWRLSLPSTAAPVALDGDQTIEWGGSLRWLRTALPMQMVRDRAAQLGGHATLFRDGDRTQGVFAPLSPAVLAIHQRLKQEFDPAGIFNPGRMYSHF